MTANIVILTYCQSHQKVAAFLQNLSDEQLRWQLNGVSLSIMWHGWHLARWADYHQASICGMTAALHQLLGDGVQIWHHEKTAQQWGFDSTQLGYAETGMTMRDDSAIGLNFPQKTEFMDYIERAFAQAEKIVLQINDEHFQTIEQPQPLTESIYAEGTVGNAIMAHLTHINRHLGMMECLLGLQGMSGTASR